MWACAVTRIALARWRGGAEDGGSPDEATEMGNARWSPLLCLLLAAAGHAQSNVYKCVDGPHPVYQQMPCQGRAEWRWEVPREESLARGPASPTAGRAAGRPRTPRPGRARGALIPLSADPAACTRARQQRGKRLAKAKRLDFVQRRQLDDAVYDACR